MPETESQNIDITQKMQQAYLASEQGNPEQAIRQYQEVLRLQPNHVVVLNNLGNALKEQGMAEKAVPHFRKALRIRPDMSILHFNFAATLSDLNQIEEAIAYYRQALVLQPDYVDAHMNLANLLKDQGLLDEAGRHYRKITLINPNYAKAHNNLGNILKEQGMFEEAVGCFETAVQIQPDLAEAHNNLGNALKEQGRFGAALGHLRKAAQLCPNSNIESNLRILYKHFVPSWHFPMINDHERNTAYERALCKVIEPESLVLDIGSGSGLLAMMAARAGARKVVTCESISLIADKAREIISLNGFQSTVSVINKKSTSLEVGTDLPDRADILVAEIFDVGLFGEQAVPTIKHARSHLLKPDAHIIPQGATVFAALVESRKLCEEDRVQHISGFDLSPFNEFSGGYLQKRVRNFPHQMLSDPFEVFSFDFTGEPICEDKKRLEVECVMNGRCDAVVFWYRLFVDEDNVIDTGPQNMESTWMQAIQLFSPSIQVRKNEFLFLFAEHNKHIISFRPERMC